MLPAREAASRVWISNGSANRPSRIPTPVSHPQNDPLATADTRQRHGSAGIPAFQGCELIGPWRQTWHSRRDGSSIRGQPGTACRRGIINKRVVGSLLNNVSSFFLVATTPCDVCIWSVTTSATNSDCSAVMKKKAHHHSNSMRSYWWNHSACTSQFCIQFSCYRNIC